MAVEPIGLNFTAFQETPPPIPEFVNQTATEFINSIPENANNMTFGYYGIIVLITLAIFLIWLMCDRSQYGKFGYSIVRGWGIAMGITLIFGVNLIQIGYIVDLTHLGVLMGFYILMFIYIIIKNPQ